MPNLFQHLLLLMQVQVSQSSCKIASLPCNNYIILRPKSRQWMAQKIDLYHFRLIVFNLFKPNLVRVGRTVEKLSIETINSQSD